VAAHGKARVNSINTSRGTVTKLTPTAVLWCTNTKQIYI